MSPEENMLIFHLGLDNRFFVALLQQKKKHGLMPLALAFPSTGQEGKV